MPAFRVGDIVCVKADPSRRGPVIDIVEVPEAGIRYRVFHTAEDPAVQIRRLLGYSPGRRG